MKIDKRAMVFALILGAALCAYFTWLKMWAFVAMFAFSVLPCLFFLISAIRKEKYEKQMDKQHSEEFKRLLSDLKNGYAYSYTEFGKERFDRIYDWEKSEFEDIIWNNYLKGSSKLAPMLPYLKKYDGIGKLKEDLASPDTPETWKKEIALVLENVGKEFNEIKEQ